MDYIYTTTVKLNTQEAKRELDKLQQRIDDLKAKKEDALSSGKNNIADQLNKEIQASERVMEQLKKQQISLSEILSTVDEQSMGRIQKAQAKLRAILKDTTDEAEMKEIGEYLQLCKNRIEEIKNESIKAAAANDSLKKGLENVANVTKNINAASYKQLMEAQATIKRQLAEMSPEDVAYAKTLDKLQAIQARMAAIEQQQKRMNTTMSQYDNEVQGANRSMAEVERETKLVERTMKRLSSSNLRDIEFSLKIINERLKETKRGTEEYRKLERQARSLNAELKKVKDTAEGNNSVFNRITGIANKMQGTIFALFSAWTSVGTAVRNSIKNFAEIEESMADVRKYTGMTDDQVRELNEEFKKIDTRTPREQLNALAGSAGRLGITSKDAIMEFVDAADKIQVALGDDLGDGAVDQVGKLAMAFGEDDKLGLRGAMLATGSAINELAQNSAANAGYLVDFAARVAGVGKQFGLTQAQIMGFGAVMDENMLRDEMASTAFSNMMTKMRTETSKFAKIAGMDMKDFTDLINNDFNGAILALADNIKKQNPETMFKMLGDMGLDGARAVGVLSALADKIDDVRSRQELATEAYAKGSSVINEFNNMNTTVQAQLDKAKEKFKDISRELGEDLTPVASRLITAGGAFVKILSTVIRFVKDNYKEIAVLTIYIAGLTTVIKINTIATTTWKAAVILFNRTIAAGQIIINGYKAAIGAFHLVVVLCTKGITEFKKQLEILKAATLTNPWTALATVILTVGTAIYYATQKFKEHEEKAKAAREATDAFIQTQRRLSEINKEANASIAEEKTRFDILRRTLNDSNASYEERKKALNKLKLMCPTYHGQLTTENKLINSNTSALDAYVKNLKQAALAQAAFNKMTAINSNIIEHQDTLNKRIGNRQYNVNKLLAMGVDENYTKIGAVKGGVKVGVRKTDENGKTTWENEKVLSWKDYREMQLRQQNIKWNDTRIKQEQTILDINQKQVDALDKIARKTVTINETKAEGTGTGQTGTGTGTGTGYVSDADKKAEEAAANKAETERQKRFREELENQKANNEQLQANNMVAYYSGKIAYGEYIKQKEDLTVQGYEKLQEIYRKYGENENKLAEELARARFERQERETKESLDNIEREYNDKKLEIEKSFYDPSSEIYGNQEALNEALFKNDIEYMRKKLTLLREGTEEYVNLEYDIQVKEKERQLELEEMWHEKLMSYREQWGMADNSLQEKIALDGLEKLHEKMMISEKEYQMMKRNIKEQFAREDSELKAEANGPGSKQRSFDTRTQTMVNNAKAAAGDAYDPTGKTGTNNPWLGSIQNYSNTMEKLRELYGKDKDNYAEYQAAKRQVTSEFLSEMVSTAQAAFDSVNNLMSAASGYYAAQSQYEQNITTKKYDAMIEKAGSNTAKSKKLEEKKQKELAKIKNKYNKKQMKIELAQAVASTALAAINSYASASKVSWVLGAIAAAMATAAGMLQIATIKKQHAAEEAGYYSGGFTGGNNYRKSAGVVHEGEFVVNHEGVNNPGLAPILSLIDVAQRNNTVGRLSSSDVSRQLGQGGSVVAPIVNVTNDNEEMRNTLNEVNETMMVLNENVKDGIPAILSMEDLDRKYKKFKKLQDV